MKRKKKSDREIRELIDRNFRAGGDRFVPVVYAGNYKRDDGALDAVLYSLEAYPFVVKACSEDK